MSATVTKETVVFAAMDIIRRHGPVSLTFEAIASELECTPEEVQSRYSDINSIISVVKVYAWDIYNSYIEEGLKMSPPFKGVGIEFTWFAINEPQLFKMIILDDAPNSTIEEFMEWEGHYSQSIEAIRSTFGVNVEDAKTICKSVWIAGVGIGSLIANGTCKMTIKEAAAMLGKTCRSAILEVKAGEDRREKFVPSADSKGPSGDIHSYIDKGFEAVKQQNQDFLLRTLINQNHVLKSIHENPRYIRNNEWIELDRVLHGAFGISSQTLETMYPSLSAGDIRIITLVKLQFSISVSAILLGISPSSVTKARQRLKSKLGINSVEQFAASL